MSWLFNSGGGHCDHCKGGQGTCACAICPQKRGSRCTRQHCPHCKGHPGGCACDYSCAKPGYAQCRPVTTSSASVSSSGALEHCGHCRGREGTCACESGCTRPSSVKCQPRGGAVSSGGSSGGTGGQHCSHCKGLDGVCACEKGCGKPYAARCRAPSHCSHCKGFDGVCACRQGCGKPRDCLCKAPGHCTHCKGGQGGCACKEGCPKPSGAQCVSSSLAEVAAVAGLLGRVSLEERVGIQPQISVNLINVCFAVDASGSMAGSSWNKARQGVNQCLGQLSDSDYCSVITFNDKVEVIDCDTKKKLNLSKFHSTQPNGNTALYDAVAQAVTAALQIRKLVDAATPLPVVTYVIILTDGEDNRSRLSLQEAQILLQQANKLRNLKVILAGINLGGAGKQAMLKLASVGDDDIRFIDLQSASDIDNLFEHISLELKAVRSTRLVVS